MSFSHRARMIHVVTFEAEVRRLIEAAGVSVSQFFSRFPAIREGKWEVANATIGKSAVQAARLYFAEHVQPNLEAVTSC